MSEDRYGRYTVVDKVGQGGMSVVYRARDPALDRVVAIKVMHPHLAERAESKARFSREARAVARLRHPHIVEVYDYAPEASEQAYIVSEFIDGPTLRQWAEDHPMRHPETAALVVLSVVEALAQAHASGVIHRDVKPENVMIRPDGAPVLMDFGIAQMVGNETLTATGTVLGSPAHMAPEVVDGHAVGAPADVFSVGTVLYWLVCGALPFTGPNPSALFRRILEGRFDPVQQRRPHAGRAMARLIEGCLAHDPAARPTAAALAEALRGLVGEAGLVDLPAERARYFGDPTVYEDGLGRALVPRLVAQARAAAAARRPAVALDLLDRALTLDEHHPEAEALLARLERGQRRGQRLRWAVVAVVVLGVVGGGVWWVVLGVEAGSGVVGAESGEGSEAGATGLPVGVVGADATAGLVPATAALDPATAALDPATAALDPATAAGARVDAGAFADAGAIADGSAITDAGAATSTDGGAAASADSGPAARPDAARPTTRPAPRARRRAPPPATPPATPPAAATRAVVEVHGQLKGALVHVDDKLRGYLFEIERDDGLVLGEGRHTVRITHKSCADQVHPLTIAPRQKRAPPIEFTCDHRPATLRIEAPATLDVRRSDDGARLGRTNQDIRVPMAHLSARLGLTIGAPGDSFDRQTVTLNAGERTVVRLAEHRP